MDGVSNTWQRYIALVGMERENERLVDENARLRAELFQRDEILHENERLRLLVGLQESAPQIKMIFAEVIGTSPSPLFRSLRLNRGTDHGVRVGSAVVTYDGVVGRVAATGAGFADVMLLIDPNTSTDVLVQRTRARARVRGGGDDSALGIDVQYLARTVDVEPGDLLITSGVGSVFPKGLPVGRVLSVERSAFGLYQHAIAKPSVDFSRIEAVMVIPEGWPKGSTLEHGGVMGAVDTVGTPSDSQPATVPSADPPSDSSPSMEPPL